MSNKPREICEALEALRGGDESAIERLAAQCYERMGRLARALIRRFGLALDIDPEVIANSAFFRLWHASTSGKLPEFDGDAAFWRYVGRVVSHLVMDARTARFAVRRGGGEGWRNW